jgi:hypothetical protein
MAQKRSVWILDIYDFLTYLERVLDCSADRFPWIIDHQPLDLNYPWTAVNRFQPSFTQRDVWIDWVIRQRLSDVHYIEAYREDDHPEFQMLLDHLRTHHDYDTETRLHFYFPRLLGDIHTHAVHRQSCWLYVELTYDPTQQIR